MHENAGNVHIAYSDYLDATAIRQFYYEIILGGMSVFLKCLVAPSESLTQKLAHQKKWWCVWHCLSFHS